MRHMPSESENCRTMNSKTRKDSQWLIKKVQGQVMRQRQCLLVVKTVTRAV